jgi:hypothetical protein
MKKLIAFIKLVAAYSVAHPFTYDCLAGFFAYLTASLGWFKPWIPAALVLYLLARIFLLRREVKKWRDK